MFRNAMPRYEILSEDAMATLDAGWRRLVSEIGVEFGDARALELFRQAGQKVEDATIVPVRPRLRARAGRQGARDVRRAGPQPREHRPHRRRRTWRSAPSTARRSCARARCAGTPRWTTSATSPASPRASPCSTRRAGSICEPNDTPLDSRHLDMTYALQTLTDKIYMGNVVSGRERRGHPRDDRDPVRRPGDDRADARDHLADQLQLPAALGRPHARGAVRLQRGQPGRRDHAVPADGRDVAGVDPGDAGPADRRGAHRDRAVAADPARAAR